MVYARPEHQGRPLTFGVSGLLWRASLIMFDRETSSLWSHVTGGSVSGPLQGARLQMLPALHTIWGLWRSTYPATRVLDKGGGLTSAYPHRWERSYTLGVVVGDQASSFPFDELGREPLAHETVGGRPLLVAFLEPAATAVAFDRRMEGRTLTFRNLTRQAGRWHMEDRETGSRWNALTGEAVSGALGGRALAPVPATQAFRAGWLRLYPRAVEWRAGAREPGR